MITLNEQTLTLTSQPEVELRRICELLKSHINQTAFSAYLGANERFQVESLNGMTLCCNMAIEYGAVKINSEVLVPLNKFGALDTVIETYSDNEAHWLRLSRDSDAPIEIFNLDNARTTHCKSVEIPFSKAEHAQTVTTLLSEAIAYAIL